MMIAEKWAFMNIPEVISTNARSEAATKRHARERTQKKEKEFKITMNERKFDWHLFLSALGIVITLGSIVFGCFFSLKKDLGDIGKEIAKIETVLIIQKIAPPELFSSKEEE